MNNKERAIQAILLEQEYKKGRHEGHLKGFGTGLELGIMLVCWILHERYNWNSVIPSIADDALRFAEDYMSNEGALVKINELREALEEECGLFFTEGKHGK